MKVSNLQLFLCSLRSAVTAADDHSSLPQELEAVSAGLEPFALLDIGQFASFLRQAEQYRTSGAVSLPLAGQGADQVQAGLRTAASLAYMLSSAEALDTKQAVARREEAQRDLEMGLAAFLKALAIKVTFKDEKKEFEATLKKARTRAHAARVRAVLHGVADEASLNAPERQGMLREIVDQLQPADLKAIATELGAPAAGGKDVLLSAIVERVTGLKTTGTKAKRASGKPAVDQAVVQQQAVKLKGFLEKSLDPGGLSNSEVEGAISQLEGRSVAELQAIAKEVGLEKAGKTKDGILKKIQEKLREVERARESIQV